MDAQTILRIRPALSQFLRQFEGCMGRVPNQGHLETYVSGQLSDLQRKSIEPMADAAGQPPRTLQEFLSLLRWDECAVRDLLQRRVAQRHGHPHSVGIIDETSFPKRGRNTACVQRQHCGARGKTDNCVVSVHLGYAAGDFHTLLDGELYLPEKTWHQDRERCRTVGVPDEVVYQPKWQIALGQVQRALGNGVRFGWLTFDEGYGSKPPFLRALDRLGQHYVAETPSTLVGWTKPPEILYRRHSRDKIRGRPRNYPRLKVRNTRACEVRNLATCSPVLRRLPWVKYHVKDGAKGPMVWEAKCMPFWIKDDQGLPSRPHRLMVVRGVLNPNEWKFFLSNAPATVPVETLLLVAFSRWRIERMFEDSKDELGMDHFEVRKYLSIQRHLIVTCVSHLFLAELLLSQRGKKPRTDPLPGTNRDHVPGADLVSRRTMLETTGRTDRRRVGRNATAQRGRKPLAPKTDDSAATCSRGDVEGHMHLPMAEKVAL